VSDSGPKATVDSHSWGYQLGRWLRRHPRGRWVAAGAVALLFIAALAALVTPGTTNRSSDTIAMPASSSDLKGENYKDVMTQLQTAGFTSIETTKLPDLILGWLTKDGEVEAVSINGKTDFDADSRFPSGAKIVITYHTFPDTESDKAAESSSVPGVATPQAETSSVPGAPKPQAQPSSDLAKRTEKAVLKAFGARSFTALLGKRGMEGSLIPFIAGLEVVGAGDTVKVTVQVTPNETTKKELDRTAFVILSLVGEQVTDLNRVEVWTANNELYGVSNRLEVPMLNR